jgi:hypothetical protein
MVMIGSYTAVCKIPVGWLRRLRSAQVMQTDGRFLYETIKTTSMYPLIPYKYFVIYTNISSEKAERLAADNIAPPRSLFQARTPGKEFEGSVASDGFTINRIISYRNSFLPILNGRFKPLKKGTKISIYITWHPIILILSPIFLYPFFEMVVIAIKDLLINGHITASNLDSTGTSMGFLYLIGQILFVFEAKKVEQFVRKIYEKHEQFPYSEKTVQQQSTKQTAFIIVGLVFIAGLFISWLYFGR